MAFDPFEVTTPHVIYALLGGFIVIFGMFSLLLRERLYIGEAIWAFLFGVIIGPYCANVFNPRAWGDGSEETTNAITLEFTRIVLAIGVFAVGVELPKAYMAKHWRSLLFLLVPVMTWGWFVSAGLIYALIPALDFLSSLAVAACLTPTDPILAAAVVGGKWADKHVPAHIRHLLAAESGCNDGAAFPFLFISLYLIIARSTGQALKDWILILWLYQVILGCVIGGLLGFGFRHLMKFCQRHDLIDRQSYVAQYISLAILAIGITSLLGSDDLLAAFSCGVAFAWDGFFNRQTEEAVFSSVIDTLFNIAAFVYVGAWMPFDKFEDKLLTLEVWRLLVIAILVLILRRLPIMIALYKWIPDIKTFREAVFSGHFGPIGIGAVFISTLATEILRHAQEEDSTVGAPQTQLLMQTIQPIVAFMVLCSITIHGLSIPSFSLGRRVHTVSRTWSRRDTTNSTGARTPEWANQARLVTRREDIVINRDPIQLPPDLEKAPASSTVFSSTPASQSLQDMGTARVAENDDLAESLVDQQNIEASTGTRTNTSDTQVSWRSPTQTQFSGPHTRGIIARDYKDEEPPDGTNNISEWREGKYHVIERRTGPGEDVEVTVTNEDPSASDAIFPHRSWNGKLQELEKKAEEWGMGIRDAIKEIGASGKGDLNGGPDSAQDTTRSLGEGANSPSARDDDADGWASDTTSDADENGGQSSSGKGVSDEKQRSGKMAPHHPHKSRRRSSVKRGHTGDKEAKAQVGEKGIVDSELRGRENRPSSSRSAKATITFAGGTTYAKSRPGTADTYLSRKSAGDSNLRNHRVESLRTMRSGPPTRESSPSRSVRFDIGSSSPRKHGSVDFSAAVDASKDSRNASPISSPLASAQVSRSPSPIPGYPKQS